MKKFILTLICLFCFSVSCFASEQEAVDSFKTMTNNIVSEIQDNFNSRQAVIKFVEASAYNKAYWFKTKPYKIEVSMDIVKTDSLLSPYKGILVLRQIDIEYHDANNDTKFNTKEDAYKAIMNTENPDLIINRYTYLYQDNQWILSKSEFRFADEYSWTTHSTPYTPKQEYIR